MPLFDEFLKTQPAEAPPFDLSDPKISKSIGMFDDLLSPEDLEQQICEEAKPVAIILFWTYSSCQCGATSGGPRYGDNPFLKRYHKRTKTWHYEPLAQPQLFPQLPHRVDILNRKISHCPSCFSPTPGEMSCRSPSIDAGALTVVDLFPNISEGPQHE